MLSAFHCGAWAAVHGVARSRTRLSDFTFTFPFHALEKEMATHSSVLAWRVPVTADPGGLPSMGSHRVGHAPASAAAPQGSSPVPEAAAIPAQGLHGGLLQEAGGLPICWVPDSRAVLVGAAASQTDEHWRPGQRAGLEAWSWVLETLRGGPKKGVRYSPEGRKTNSLFLTSLPIQRSLGSEQPGLSSPL